MYTNPLPAVSAARLALIRSVNQAMEEALALHEYGAHAFLQEMALGAYGASPPLQQAEETPGGFLLVRWHALPPAVRQALDPLVDDGSIALVDGSSLPYSDLARAAIQSFPFRGATAQALQGPTELFVERPPEVVIAYLLCASNLFGFAPGLEEEAAAFTSLIDNEARWDASACFQRGFPASMLIAEDSVRERGRELSSSESSLTGAFVALWVELYPVLFSVHYTALAGGGGDEIDLLNDNGLWYFVSEQLLTYKNNVLSAMIAADYLAWREGAAQRFYQHPNCVLFQERGQFGFMDVIGQEGQAVLLPGQTCEDLPLAHRAIIWRGLTLLERYELAQGETLPSPAFEGLVPSCSSEVVNLERAHRYFARLYPDPMRAWIVYPAWAGRYYDAPGDGYTHGYLILPTWLRSLPAGRTFSSACGLHERSG